MLKNIDNTMLPLHLISFKIFSYSPSPRYRLKLKLFLSLTGYFFGLKVLTENPIVTNNLVYVKFKKLDTT